MLIRTKVIGIGQAGNKAAIMAVDKGVIRKEDCLLVNTTSRDIPTEYKNDAIIFGDELNGCGKERDIAKTLFVEYTSTNEFFNIITNFFSEEEDDDVLYEGALVGNPALITPFGIFIYNFVFNRVHI